ncbi:DUF4059 family protein [Streptococcus caprae]|uniref:DUF4059 family protein n=1 Tax=Streptococcus caprae TaxID=1640501 RepID=A0ABV8CUR8_9STRE
MLTQVLGAYLLGLLIASIVVFAIAGGWIFLRALRKVDKTAAARQSVLFDALMMSLVSIPVLSFAVMAIILMIRA